MKAQFADLHCHPAFRPYNNETLSLWDPPKSDLEAIKAGKRASCYSQADMPKLMAGEVGLVFAALYPFEKPWIQEHNAVLRFLSKPYKWIKAMVYRIGISRNPASRFFSIKDDLINGFFLRFNKRRYLRIQDADYWEELMWELRLYKEEDQSRRPIKKLVAREKPGWDSRVAARLEKSTGAVQFRILDTADSELHPDRVSLPEQEVRVVLTIEGMHALSMDKNLEVVPEKKLFDRMRYLKEKTAIFFITFAHHFDNGLCGHARSMPVILRTLGLVKQESRINEGFTDLGRKALLFLLGIKQEQGEWIPDPDAGRRILIDVKHMSAASRIEYYAIVRAWNEAHPDEKIPIIASHMGYAALSLEQLRERAQSGRETRQKQIRNGYNRWSINLGTDEVAEIVNSEGLIGMSFDQKILGMIPLFLGLGKRKKDAWPQLIGMQILDIVEASRSSRIWDCLALGTDFDGVIDPMDPYATALDFPNFREDLIRFFESQLQENYRYYFLENASPAYIRKIVDKICGENAYRFMELQSSGSTLEISVSKEQNEN